MKNKYINIAILLFFVCFKTMFAQSFDEDLKEKSDEEKAKYYFALANTYAYNDTALGYFHKALAFSELSTNRNLEIDILHKISIVYFMHSNLDSAEIFALREYDLARKDKITQDIINSVKILGAIKSYQEKYTEAIELFDIGIQNARVIKDTVALGQFYNNLGRTYLSISDNKYAIEFLEKAYEIFKIRGNNNQLTNILANLAEAASEKETANKYLDEAIILSEEIEDKTILNYIYDQIGKINLKFKDYDKALEGYLKSYDFPGYSNEARAGTIASIAIAYNYLNQPDNALNYVSKYFEEIPKTDQDASSLQSIYHQAAIANEALGNFELAYQNSIKSLALIDSVNQAEIDNKFVEYNARFRSEEKEKEIISQKLEIAKQKNIRQRTLIGGILIFLLSLIAFQYYFQKQKRKKQDAEHDLLLQQTETASLKKLDILKTQFFTNISHELRTPLTLISGPLENALEKTTNTVIEKDIKTAYKQSNKLSNLVNELLDFSKLESGKLEIQKKKVQLNYLIKRIFWAFESMADLREIKLVAQISVDENLWVLIDDNKLEKILNNLISNALKFTGRKGTVTLTASDANGALQLKIKDSGNGIHPNDVVHIFERFYQSQQKSEALQGGTGIGLALCKELTELMHGKIEVKSELGQGSTFTVELPIEKTSEGSMNNTESLVSEPEDVSFVPLFINGEKPKILIVEDNYEMSRYINELLSQNYNCTVAYDGEEALKKLKQQNFDLISCDVMMPNMDGFTFRTEVNKLDQYKSIPFVMLTARAIEEDKLRGLQMGVDDYITKPFSKLELEARVHNLVQNKIQRAAAKSEETLEEETANVEISFLKQVEQTVMNNLSNTDFKIADLAGELNYSQRQLSRILKKSIGLSPVAYILEIRLQKARQLLEQKKFNSVKEVQFEIGIDSASYFASKFKERFGKSPSSYFE